jgi:hypothetical protein
VGPLLGNCEAQPLKSPAPREIVNNKRLRMDMRTGGQDKGANLTDACFGTWPEATPASNGCT